MTKLRQQLCILLCFIAGLMGPSRSANAQFSSEMIDTGKVIGNLKMNDISGKKTLLYDYLSEGYTVILELGKTTCPICWAFHEAGTFENIYKKYGPEGTVSPKKIMPIFVEVDRKSSMEDLQGTGPMTLGNWINGASYPIIDLERADTLDWVFQRRDIFMMSTPTFVIICPDRKLVYTANGATGMSEELAVDIMEGRCAKGQSSTGIEEVLPGSAVRVYPNPTQGILQISLETLAEVKLRLSVTNLVGQTCMNSELHLSQGRHTTSLHTGNLASGMYILSLITEQGMIQEKFIVQ